MGQPRLEPIEIMRKMQKELGRIDNVPARVRPGQLTPAAKPVPVRSI